MKGKRYFGLFKEGSKIKQVFCAVLKSTRAKSAAAAEERADRAPTHKLKDVAVLSTISFLYSPESVISPALYSNLNLPVFAYGASIGWMSPMALLLQSSDSPTGQPLSNFHISWMASIAYLVCVGADLLMAYMGDRFGRKFSLMFVSASLSVSWILMLCSLNVYVMIFARATVGIVMGGSFVTCPVYTKEISDDSIRGALGCLVTLFQTSGNLFLYVIGDVLSYRTILWICLSLPLFHLVTFVMMPESPSYLMKIGKVEEAQKVLAWLKCREKNDPVIQHELERIKKEQLRDEESSKFMLKAIVTDKILYRAFWIATVVVIGREVCGAITVQNFAGEIFAVATEDSDLVLTPNQQAMLLGIMQVAGAVLASAIVEKVGRKSLLLITALLSGLSMCALASWFLLREFNIFSPAWLPIVTLCICIFCDSLGLQPISVVLVGEIFSYKYRGTMLAVTMSVASALGFLQLLFFKTISYTIGVYATFFFFGVVCLSVALYVTFVVPETKNRPLEDIYSDLKTKKEKAIDKQEKDVSA